LSENHHRMTRQRKMILDTLKNMDTHPTADEVYDIVRRHIPHISLGTVYRNLDVLSEMGIILRLDYGGGQRRFDGNPDRHLHLKCLECGAVIDIPREKAGDIDLGDDTGEEYEILDYSLHFVGLCGKCNRNRSKTS